MSANYIKPGQYYFDLYTTDRIYKCISNDDLNEILNMNPVIHRDDDEPSVVSYMYNSDLKLIVYKKVWWKNGHIHRIGGPAIEYNIPGKNQCSPFMYFINGKELEPEEYKIQMRKYKMKKLIQKNLH